MSSLIYLGFSVVVFLISYGISFLLLPTILGTFFSAFPGGEHIADPAWRETYLNTESIVRWLIPLVPTVGIFMFVLKVLMVASVRGQD